MKNIKHLAIFALFLPTLAFAQGGHTTGNGGKGINAFLTNAIVQIDELLMNDCKKTDIENSPWREKACLVPDKLFDQIMKTKVSSEYIVYGKIDNKPRDSINYALPNGEEVVVYSIRNLKIGTPDERRRVILHEFMTLAGFEKSDSYGYSTLVLNFLSQHEDISSILATLPIDEMSEEKMFRSIEATIQQGDSSLPVLIESPADYQYFCIAKGFGDYTSAFIKDEPYGDWRKENPDAKEGAVKLNSDGLVIQTVAKPANKAHVIESITCK